MNTPYSPFLYKAAVRALWSCWLISFVSSGSYAQSVRFRVISAMEAERIMGSEWRPDEIYPTGIQKKPIRKYRGDCAPFNGEEWMYEYTFTLEDGVMRRIVETQGGENGENYVSNQVKGIRAYETKAGKIYVFKVIDGYCRSEAFRSTIAHYAGAPGEGVGMPEQFAISPEGVIIDADGTYGLTVLRVGRSQRIFVKEQWKHFAEKEKLLVGSMLFGNLPRKYEAYYVKGNPNACLLRFPPTEGEDAQANRVTLKEAYVLIEW